MICERMSMAFARMNARTDGICLALTLLHAVKKATFCVGPRSRNDTDDEVEEDAGGLSRHAYFFCKIRTATCFLSRREVGRTSFVDTGRVDLFSLDPPPTLPVLWPLRCVVSARKEDFERQGSRCLWSISLATPGPDHPDRIWRARGAHADRALTNGILWAGAFVCSVNDDDDDDKSVEQEPQIWPVAGRLLVGTLLLALAMPHWRPDI
jgi:hypothetical protein